MQGKIIKGIAGFYYVHVAGCGVYECKAKGIFRNQKIKPLVGDNVDIEEVEDTEINAANINAILPRRNELIRPAVANIDQAMIVFAVKSPEPDFNLLSRFLLVMEYNEIDTIICFNKSDKADKELIDKYREFFAGSGNRIIVTSVVNGEGIEELRTCLEGKTTAFAGPSGVGKSSLLNKIFPEADSQTGVISEKINRGKHTTRHTEIFNIADNTYIMDTPGFTSLEFMGIEAVNLRYFFNEFAEFEGKCRFNGCVHVNEPDCAVKSAVEQGDINAERYRIYTELYNELKNVRKY